MKIFAAISLIAVLIFTGIRVNLATHYCCGHVVDTKISFSGALASCGMEDQEPQKSHQETLTTHCCDNVISSASFSNNYFPTFYKFNDFDLRANLISDSPYVNILYADPILSGFYSGESPPGNPLRSDVLLSSICVFRI